jgi:hypothetical protein
MSYLIKAGERYSVLDHRCLGADCLALGCYQRRGATLSGSRNTGVTTLCCLTKAYKGCPPEESRGYDRVLERQRKEEGIRILKP